MSTIQDKFDSHFLKQAKYLCRTTDCWRGSSCVYQLNVPFNGAEFLVVSVIKLDNGDYEGIACACDHYGKLYSDKVIALSVGPNINHVEVLKAMGYKLNVPQN
jgi:hypothetical protein